MKKKIILILAIILVAVFPSIAQQKKIQFHSINTFELISGQSPLSTGFQSINGFRFSSWFTGAGIGVDNYNYKTLPLFFDARKFFGVEKRAFLSGDIGYNFPMKDKPGKEISYYTSYYYSSYHFTGGIYTDIGIGYQIPLYKKTNLVFSLGYSYKKLESKIGVGSFCPNMLCAINYYNYEFSYGRMILKAGLVF
ncbi:MAG: hypothetical protein KGM16_00280 [Bacteroidota bacterium]|nr:hypothetical protein [Bacteroidota bacterium]